MAVSLSQVRDWEGKLVSNSEALSSSELGWRLQGWINLVDTLEGGTKYGMGTWKKNVEASASTPVSKSGCMTEPVDRQEKERRLN